MRAVASTPLPVISAISRSTGPPGATCTIAKLMTMIPKQRRENEQQAAGRCRQAYAIRRSNLRRIASIACPTCRVFVSSCANFFLVDPPSEELRTTNWCDLGAAELVPVDQAIVRNMPIWYDDVLPLKHTVERPCIVDKRDPVRCGNQLFDELVNRGVLEAGQIARAVAVGRRRPPEITLLVAR